MLGLLVICPFSLVLIIHMLVLIQISIYEF